MPIGFATALNHEVTGGCFYSNNAARVAVILLNKERKIIFQFNDSPGLSVES